MTPTTSLLDWFTLPNTTPSILLLDGGVSTYLEHVLAEREEEFQHRELWSSSLLLTDQGCMDIAHAHEAFARAGADILSSVTYQCHYGTISSSNDDDKIVNDSTMTSMIHKGLELAKAHTKQFAAASLGCYGAALADGSEYRGDYKDTTRNVLHEFHRRKLETALEKSPDVVAFETVPNCDEVAVIVEILVENHRKRGDRIAAWISLACHNECELNDGTKVKDVLDLIHKLDPDATVVHAIGFNCCPAQYAVGLLTILTRHEACRGIVMYPNSGEEWDASTASWKHGTGCTQPQEFAKQMERAIDAVEATWKQYCSTDKPPPKMIVGGCCRTSPATIATLRDMIDRRIKKKDDVS